MMLTIQSTLLVVIAKPGDLEENPRQQQVALHIDI